MKNRLYLLLMFVFGMVACFEDDSSLGTIKVGEIEIGKLPDTTIVSFGEKSLLKLMPDIKTGYPESEMRYAWYLCDKERLEEGFRTNLICDTKELNYKVELPSGTYTIVLEATATSNSYSQLATMTLNASTDFSEGFYVLKETADGQTGLDLITEDGMFHDLKILPGKPLGFAISYDNGYIDEETLGLNMANMVHVYTEDSYAAYRTEDMVQVFNRENIMFESLPADETLYSMSTHANGNYVASNKGLYNLAFGEGSGRLGLPVCEGCARFPQMFGGFGQTVVFWDDEAHQVASFDRYDKMFVELPLPAGFEAAELECITSGLNYISADMIWFLCQDRNTHRRLLFVGENVGSDFFPEIEWAVKAVDTDKHLASADIVAGCGLKAPVIYLLDEGQLYLYNLLTESETPFTLQGLEGEIIYIANNYLNFSFPGEEDIVFNKLLVATQNGDNYKLYFYDDLTGGIPAAAAKEVREGSGRVKSVRYLSGLVTSNNWVYTLFDYAGPVYPYGD